MTEYSIEIYKIDRRRKDGKRFIEVVEVEVAEREDAVAIAEEIVAKGAKLVYEVHKTYNDVRNIMSGKIVKEHYKTPYSCSVGSEAYFSM
jgi:hypothetical protein